MMRFEATRSIGFATALVVGALLSSPASQATCPVAGGPNESTGIDDVVFASSDPNPLTAQPNDANALEGGWQVAGPGGDAAQVNPFTPRAFVELDCGALGQPACDGSHVAFGSPADGTWTVSYSSGQLPPGIPEYLHWRIAGKSGVAQISNPLVGAWIFNQHDANTSNMVGTSIQYSVTTPELSSLPGQPTLPPVFTFNAANGDRTCHYTSSNATFTQDALGDQWCNSDREFFDANEQQRVQDRQIETATAHAEFCTAAGANLPACLQAWPWSTPADHLSYPEGERFEFFWTNRAGTRLHGTLWTPAGVNFGNLNAVSRRPGFVGYPTIAIAGGVISHQPMYFWAADHLARNGYVVMLYDTAGQGRSNTGGGGFAPDLQDALDFVLSTPSSPHPYHDPVQGAHSYNPLWKLVDAGRVGIAGHSAGGSAVSSVQASDAHRLLAGVIWASGGPSSAAIPLMIQSADNDDFIFPTGSNFGQSNYDAMYEPATPLPRHIIQLRDSTHLGWSTGPFYYYTCEHPDIAAYYTLAWFDRYVKGGTPDDLAAAEARLTALYDPEPDDGRPADDYYSNQSCTRYDLDADGQSHTLRDEPGADCPATDGSSNSPTGD